VAYGNGRFNVFAGVQKRYALFTGSLLFMANFYYEELREQSMSVAAGILRVLVVMTLIIQAVFNIILLLPAGVLLAVY
jgi:hypothetical protein